MWKVALRRKKKMQLLNKVNMNKAHFKDNNLPKVVPQIVILFSLNNE